MAMFGIIVSPSLIHSLSTSSFSADYGVRGFAQVASGAGQRRFLAMRYDWLGSRTSEGVLGASGSLLCAGQRRGASIIGYAEEALTIARYDAQ